MIIVELSWFKYEKGSYVKFLFYKIECFTLIEVKILKIIIEKFCYSRCLFMKMLLYVFYCFCIIVIFYICLLNK